MSPRDAKPPEHQTRSGTPIRRAENLAVVRDWFRHYLVEGKRGLPPLPKGRAGK